MFIYLSMLRSALAIRKHYPFDEDSTLVMDFACGTGGLEPWSWHISSSLPVPTLGLLSKELAPYAKSIVGIDISQGVVDRYNLSVSNQGILPEEMRAVCAELKGRDEELDGLKFDVITVCGSSSPWNWENKIKYRPGPTNQPTNSAIYLTTISNQLGMSPVL
jgi:SAM-dependent methyltransferase